jgi:transcriptional regulator with XRE-family HTH domain
VAKRGPPAAASKQSLGSRIRRFRLERGLTQTQLGKLVGVSQRVVAYYEVKGVSPPPELLTRIADALKVSIEALFGRKKGAGSGATEPTRNVRRQRHIKRLDELPAADRKAIFRIIDALADRQAKGRSG